MGSKTNDKIIKFNVKNLLSFDTTGESLRYTNYEVSACTHEDDLSVIRSALAESRTLDRMRPRLTARISKVNQVKTLVIEGDSDLDEYKLDQLERAIQFLWGKQFTIEKSIK